MLELMGSVVIGIVSTLLTLGLPGLPELASKGGGIGEYWYNTSYHSAIEMSPFQALYGRPPPSIPPLHSRKYSGGLYRHHSHGTSTLGLLAKSDIATNSLAIGKVAYCLELPSGTLIHPIFHVSLLRPSYGNPNPSNLPLLITYIDDIPVLEPETILD
nr:Ty3/gypsy retrotransposon protein [Tanacetum cinerariifolium]